MVVGGIDSNKKVHAFLVDTSGRLYVIQYEKDRTVTNAIASDLKVEIHQPSTKETFEVIQDTPADLKATVTQAAIARTVTGTVTANIPGLTTLLHSEFTLTNADTAYQLPASEQSGRLILVIYNVSDTVMYWGGSGVATSDGMPIASTKYAVIPAASGVYAVCGSAGKKLRLVECK